MTDNPQSEIDYHRELNSLASDIRGCYYEQHRDRDQDSVANCLGEIKSDEPLEFVEYFGSRFVVGACRRREENFVGRDENSCLKGRPRVTSVTIGAELNEDGTIKGGIGAKCFVICACSRQETNSDSGSWGIPAKTSIEVSFMARDPNSFYGYNVRPHEAFASKSFYADVEGDFFNVADRAELAKALIFAETYEKGAKKQIRSAIETLVKPNEKDAQFGEIEAELQHNKELARKFAKKRERLQDPVVSRLRKLSSKIENKKTRHIVNKVGNNLTEGKLTGIGIGAALTLSTIGLSITQSSEMNEFGSEPRRTPVTVVTPPSHDDFVSEIPAQQEEGVQTKSGIQGPECIISSIRFSVSKNYLEKNNLMAYQDDHVIIDVPKLVMQLEKDNVLDYYNKQKKADYNAILTEEERRGTVEKIEDFARLQGMHAIGGDHVLRHMDVLGPNAGFVITVRHNGYCEMEIDERMPNRQSVANAASNQDKIEQMRQNKEDKPVLIEYGLEANPQVVFYENARVDDSSHLISQANERSSTINFMDALRAQKGDDSQKA